MEIIKVEINGVVYTVTSGVYDPAWKSAASGKWLKGTFAVFDRFIRPGNVVVDAGAAFGILSLYASRTAWAVHAVEPDRVNFAELKVNVGLNPHGGGEIQCHNVALADGDGRKKLYSRSFLGDSSAGLLKRSGDSGDYEYVDVRGFGTFLLENEIRPGEISLIKVDIEGGEFRMIPDMLSKLDKNTSLHLSLHGPYLGEFYLRKLIPSNFFSKLIHRIECKFRFPFLSKLFCYPLVRRKVASMLDLLDCFKYCYDEKGFEVDRNAVLEECPSRGMDLVFTNIKSMSLTLANWLVIVIETSAPIIKISRELSTRPYRFNSFGDNVMYV